MKYLYKGPISGVTLEGGKEVMLLPGKEVELDAGHPYTKTLLALGHLTPVRQAPVAPKLPAKPKTKEVTDGR